MYIGAEMIFTPRGGQMGALAPEAPAAETPSPFHIKSRAGEDLEGLAWDTRIDEALRKWNLERDARERFVRIYKDGRFAAGEEDGVNVNLCFAYVSGLTAFLMGQAATIEVEPRRGMGDEAFSEVIKRWLDYSYAEGQSQDDHEVAVFDAILRGISWLKESYDPVRRCDVCDELSPLDVYVDPVARYRLSQARYIIQRVVKPIEEARLTFNRNDLEPNYMLSNAEGLEGERGRERDSAKDLLLFFEIWCKKAGGERQLFYRLRESAAGPMMLRDPAPWPYVLDHDEFPFSELQFNSIYMGVDGFSEMAVVDGLDREVQEMAEFDRRHGRKGAATKLLVDAGALAPEEEQKIKSAKDYEIVRIKTGGRPVGEVLQELNLVQNDAEAQGRADRAKRMRDEVLGWDELLQGANTRNKTATEADIIDEWGKVRIGKRQRAIDKWQSRSARHRAQIARLLVDPETVAKAVGPEAAAVWAQFAGDAEDLVREYSIGVAAGSTGERYRRMRVQQAQESLELYATTNEKLMAMGLPPKFDIGEAAIEVERAKGTKNPERFLLPPPPAQPPQMPGMAPGGPAGPGGLEGIGLGPGGAPGAMGMPGMMGPGGGEMPPGMPMGMAGA